MPNLTLTVTDVYSGWVWLTGLLNKAHQWTLEALQSVYLTALFRILEFQRQLCCRRQRQ